MVITRVTIEIKAAVSCVSSPSLAYTIPSEIEIDISKSKNQRVFEFNKKNIYNNN